jgi:hypothetical protein
MRVRTSAARQHAAALHGAQEKAHLDRYCDNYCYLSLDSLLLAGHPGVRPASQQLRPGQPPERAQQTDHAAPAPGMAT